MSKRTDALITTLEAIIEPVCLAHGVELVEVRHVPQKSASVIRITIDRARADGKDGSDITLTDCTDVSRDVSAAMDVHEEAMPPMYHLEVSSPGIERPLVKPADFERFAGREVALRTLVPFGPTKQRKFQGVLRGLVRAEGEEEFVELNVSGADVRIPFESITQANLVYRF
ncbi:MAG: ribosome maturation factor RimP [Sandaracinaceae bacterium]|jgi:ribosome maturation factor RimP|nr:ribosome maturation factor RimP [Sandaracinaceae bacterium]MBK6810686.1 ribosome maturation factor RimP [Sandaracinaceae bacterium]MBK7155071.1 ribosome maturation factor RimP [Sandaracinaceae bacterium]MBK7774117.1 ribosome maturation factor RimP [Sandaracinaceae bacterium]MBK8409812.1 ribosome maturation factor RimP [Sandaracinaceae bacterium]